MYYIKVSYCRTEYLDWENDATGSENTHICVSVRLHLSMYQNFNLVKWTSIYRNGHIYSKVFSRTVAILTLRNKPIASFRFIVHKYGNMGCGVFKRGVQN